MIELRFHPDEKEFISSVLPEREPKSPVYLTVGKETRGGIEYTVFTYSFYYKNNGAIGLGWQLFPTSRRLGYHDHDVEFVSLYCEGDEVKMVYFSAHAPGQGTWVAWDECEMSEDDNLVVYVARNSHACYPHPGTYWRIFGFANDVCSQDGRSLVLTVQDVIPSYDCVFSNGVRLCANLRPAPLPTVLTFWQRFCLPVTLFWASSKSRG